MILSFSLLCGVCFCEKRKDEKKEKGNNPPIERGLRSRHIDGVPSGQFLSQDKRDRKGEIVDSVLAPEQSNREEAGVQQLQRTVGAVEERTKEGQREVKVWN